MYEHQFCKMQQCEQTHNLPGTRIWKLRLSNFLLTVMSHLIRGNKVPTRTTPESNFKNSDLRGKFINHSGNGDGMIPKQQSKNMKKNPSQNKENNWGKKIKIIANGHTKN